MIVPNKNGKWQVCGRVRQTVEPIMQKPFPLRSLGLHTRLDHAFIMYTSQMWPLLYVTKDGVNALRQYVIPNSTLIKTKEKTYCSSN